MLEIYINQQSMRLSSIIRRTLPFTPSRAGIPPTWDRPDPPATKKFPRTRRQTTEEKHFTFFDAASPSFLVVNSEVAEGDLGEALPNFLKNIAMILVTGTAIGLIGYLYATRPTLQISKNFNYQVSKLAEEKALSEQKYGLKDLQNNPWKLNVWPESFPISNGAIQDQPAYTERCATNIDNIRKINSEARAYWARLYDEAEKAIKSGAAGHGHH